MWTTSILNGSQELMNFTLCLVFAPIYLKNIFDHRKSSQDAFIQHSGSDLQYVPRFSQSLSLLAQHFMFEMPSLQILSMLLSPS